MAYIRFQSNFNSPWIFNLSSFLKDVPGGCAPLIFTANTEFDVVFSIEKKKKQVGNKVIDLMTAETCSSTGHQYKILQPDVHDHRVASV